MLVFHPKSAVPCVRYFYLPARNGRQAEIIQVLNCRTHQVQVPMREEDMQLSAFFERDLTPQEKSTYKNSETWKVYGCWDELANDHLLAGLKREVLQTLFSVKFRYPLQENFAVSA